MWGLILCGLVGAATVAAGAYYEAFARQARVTHVRARLSSLESLVRSMAFQPYAYKCGNDNGAASAIEEISSCAPRPEYFQSVALVPMAGSTCKPDPDGSCGFTVDQIKLDVSSGKTGVFTARISYTGQEILKLKPSLVNLVIPTELLQASRFDCALLTPERPVFVGFTARGQADCRGFTPLVNGAVAGATSAPCPQGTYATSVDFKALTVTCTNLDTPDKHIDCGAGQALTSLTWTNGTFKATCGPITSAPFNPAP